MLVKRICGEPFDERIILKAEYGKRKQANQ
jgi:hypothetical protein